MILEFCSHGRPEKRFNSPVKHMVDKSITNKYNTMFNYLE